MDTPQRTPIKTQLARFRAIKLAIGTTIVALVAVIGNKCNSCVENALRDGGATVSDASTNDDETYADGGEFLAESNDGGSGEAPSKVIVVKTDAEQLSAIIDGNSLDKRIWDKMDSLMGALRRYYILPEFEDEDGHRSCDNADRVGPGLSMRRQSSDFGTQWLTISSGIPGCSASDMASISWRPYGPNNELQLHIDMSALDPEMGIVEIPATDGDIGIIRRFVDRVDEYEREQAKLKSALRDYWGKGVDKFDLEAFEHKTGSSNPNEAECRLKARTRALIAQERYRLKPPVFAEEDSAEYIRAQQERVQLQQQDQGDLRCGVSQDE